MANQAPNGVSTSEAAERLGISPSGLRRLARIYEDKRGKLPRDNQRGRVWPEEIIDQLEQARALVHEERAVSIEKALELLEQEARAANVLPPHEGGNHRVFEALVDEIRLLRQAVERQTEVLQVLHPLAQALDALLENHTASLEATSQSSLDTPDEPERSMPDEPGLPRDEGHDAPSQTVAETQDEGRGRFAKVSSEAMINMIHYFRRELAQGRVTPFDFEIYSICIEELEHRGDLDPSLLQLTSKA